MATIIYILFFIIIYIIIIFSGVMYLLSAKSNVIVKKMFWGVIFTVAVLSFVISSIYLANKTISKGHDEHTMIENTIRENFNNTTFNDSNEFVSDGILYEYSIVEDEKVINIKSSKDNEHYVTTSINYETGKILYDYRR